MIGNGERDDMTQPHDDRLIRVYADGEMPEELLRDFESRLAADPGLRAHVEFERGLRGAVKRCCGGANEMSHETVGMTGAAAPAWLADRVRGALDEQTAVVGRVTDAEPDGDRSTRMNHSIRMKGLFRSPTQASFLAVAASLLLVAGAVILGIFGPQIDTLRKGPELVVAAAAVAAGEHGRTESRELDAKCRAACDTEKMLSERLGVAVKVIDLTEAGYEFVDSELCAMPGVEECGKLLYRRIPEAAGDKTPKLSLFVMADEKQFAVHDGARFGPLSPGKCHCITKNKQCQKDVRVWTDGTRVFFLVCCDTNDLQRMATFIQTAGR